MMDKVFPEKMKQARTKQNLTIEALAELTNLSASYLFDIESGRRVGTIKSLVTIAKALGLSLDDIYDL